MISPSEAIRNYLSLQTSVTDLLPIQAWASGTTLQKKQASLFVNRAPQAANKPFVIIGLLDNEDEGSHSDGACRRKIGQLVITVNGDKGNQELYPIAKAIKSKMSLRQLNLPSDAAEDRIYFQAVVPRNLAANQFQDNEGQDMLFTSYVIYLMCVFDE